MEKEKLEKDEDILNESIEEVMNYIIDEYGEEIKRLIFTYVKDYASTDDMFQEFLIKVYKKISSFKREAKLRSWLYRIAINTCKDYLRSPINRLLALNDTLFSEKEKSAEEMVILKENNVRLAEVVLSLPIKYREILVLRFYQSFSIQQISEALNMKESTVKTRISRGKSKLRQKLGGDINE
ncbi:sigma-70 family RNA polymerase sigma factor [Halobacillus litoralis]|uniref:sigma-70 family RNA polymerase sigma factor n=1 Tax=Halobacillus litoralis TaxID=45668 RepID=UPI001CFD4555|nr:sigma-70 family RNA polymerase sigma factor [Halobacillus litoralis]WLR46483.1 sigma-70 family RNA polymerase sigma factor [Halobacillus litoralis]